MNSSSITQMRFIWTLAALLVVNAFVPTGAASAQRSIPSHPLIWTTLGTQGGPILDAKRSQPANLLVVNGKPWLVDCGDGALERLAAAGYRPLQVKTVFISHLHMDHIGGLQGLIGLRWFGTGKHTLFTIYGPPGNRCGRRRDYAIVETIRRDRNGRSSSNAWT
jgi:ribonuclease BN (tRNA processing enzyme)